MPLRVFQVTYQTISLSVPKIKKVLTTNERQITFIKQVHFLTSKSSVGTTHDGNVLLDMYEEHCKIPEDVGAFTFRPDIFGFLEQLCIYSTYFAHCTIRNKYT